MLVPVHLRHLALPVSRIFGQAVILNDGLVGCFSLTWRLGLLRLYQARQMVTHAPKAVLCPGTIHRQDHAANVTGHL